VERQADDEGAVMSLHQSCLDRLEAYLRDQGVAYKLERHPLAYTARGVADSEHLSARQVAKAVIIIADGRPVMVVLPASHELQLNELAQGLGASEARLAEESEFAPIFPDCETGAMPPFGNLYGLRVYMDSSLCEDGSLVLQAGTHTDTMRIACADFKQLVKPSIVHLARYRHHPRMPV
jgi:Ala-tRNA(Pro) deacylase